MTILSQDETNIGRVSEWFQNLPDSDAAIIRDWVLGMESDRERAFQDDRRRG